MSEFDQVEWEAPYEFPPGPKPFMLEAESPEAGKFGPLHVFAVVPLDAAEKAVEAGVQAERERLAGELEARIEKAEKALPALGDSVAGKMQRAGIGAFRAALAVVTGKEGASDES